MVRRFVAFAYGSEAEDVAGVRRARRPGRRRRRGRCRGRSSPAPWPSRRASRISGLAQWWPARTHTLRWSSTWLTVVGVDAAEGEAQRGAADLDVGRAVDRDVVAVALGQRVDRVGGDVHLVAADVGHADRAQVVDRGAEPDRFGDRRRAGLELGRQLGAGVKPSRRTSAIMLPPPRNGGIASSSSSRPHSTPMPVGPHILWLLKATKSAPHACTSVTLWGTYWQPSTIAIAPAAWAASAQLGHGCDRAEHVGHRA